MAPPRPLSMTPNAIRLREMQASQKAKGLCRYCDRPLATETVCEFHRQKKLTYRYDDDIKKKRDRRIAEGKCAYTEACLNTPVPGKMKCREHLDASNQIQKNLYRRQVATGEMSTTWRFSHAASAAKRRGLRWELTLEQYESLLRDPCGYCGLHDNNCLTGPGLDRKDNDGHYTFKNSIRCCFLCNQAKSDFFTYSEMKGFLGPAINDALTSRSVPGVVPQILSDDDLPDYQRFQDSVKAAKNRFNSLRWNATKRGIEPFDIDINFYLELAAKECYYCGLKALHRSADRSDNSVGYTHGNCVPCCQPCNVAKSDRFTESEAKRFLGPAIRAIMTCRLWKEARR